MATRLTSPPLPRKARGEHTRAYMWMHTHIHIHRSSLLSSCQSSSLLVFISSPSPPLLLLPRSSSLLVFIRFIRFSFLLLSSWGTCWYPFRSLHTDLETALTSSITNAISVLPFFRFDDWGKISQETCVRIHQTEPLTWLIHPPL